MLLHKDIQAALQCRMRAVLEQVVAILFPVEDDPAASVIPHVWRDRRYVGEEAGVIRPWKGWSCNLSLHSPAYRVLYLDMVESALSLAKCRDLFGDDFCQAVSGTPAFIVMFIVDCPATSRQVILRRGFVPRVVSRTLLHACVTASPDDFLAQPVLVWAAQGATLANLQRDLHS